MLQYMYLEISQFAKNFLMTTNCSIALNIILLWTHTTLTTTYYTLQWGIFIGESFHDYNNIIII